MTTSVNVHNIVTVYVDREASYGTDWVNFRFLDAHGDEVFEVTAFQPADALDMRIHDAVDNRDLPEECTLDET